MLEAYSIPNCIFEDWYYIGKAEHTNVSYVTTVITVPIFLQYHYLDQIRRPGGCRFYKSIHETNEGVWTLYISASFRLLKKTKNKGRLEI